VDKQHLNTEFDIPRQRPHRVSRARWIAQLAQGPHPAMKGGITARSTCTV
jgi:hypothetical protein